VPREQPGWGQAVESYQAWYQTPRGKRYDALEKELLTKLLPPAKGRRLLEIGCGTGHFARWLDRQAWRVWGLDLEERMLAWARERSGKRIVYCQGDAEALPFGDCSFDVCTMITTLEATAHPEAALAEAFRVSREEIILGILNSMSLLALNRRIRAVFRPTIFSRTRFYSGPGLSAMIRRVARQCGFSISLSLVSKRSLPFADVPLGAFFAMGVKLKK
jgi:ubiquinone/menaquinone biosynthesis C-methylase UbiE